jgi:hypothetical protein
MHRVLTGGGRIGISVWQSLDRHPFYQTLHDVLQHQLGMSGVQDIFELGNADELGTLLADAGCDNVEIKPVSITARFPDPQVFLAGEIDLDTAAIPSMQHLDAQARQAIVAAISKDMEAPLRMEGDHNVIPFHAHIALARRPLK